MTDTIALAKHWIALKLGLYDFINQEITREREQEMRRIADKEYTNGYKQGYRQRRFDEQEERYNHLRNYTPSQEPITAQMPVSPLRKGSLTKKLHNIGLPPGYQPSYPQSSASVERKHHDQTQGPGPGPHKVHLYSSSGPVAREDEWLLSGANLRTTTKLEAIQKQPAIVLPDHI